MAIVSPDKIFIDTKDEITFVVERVMNSDKNKVIIVVPQNSLLLSSVISVNILFRRLLESKKIGVIVTEDDYGQMIAEKVGFHVASKVSQITPEVWELAQKTKQKYLDILAKKRASIHNKVVPIEEKEEDHEEINEISEKDILDKGNLFAPVESKIQNSNQADDVKNLPVNDYGYENPKVEYTNVKDFKKKTDDVNLDNIVRKPKREFKVTTLGSIKVVGGGDVESLTNLDQNAKMDASFNNMDMNDEMIDRTKLASLNSQSSSKREFIGKDFTKAVKSKQSFGGFFGKSNKPAVLDGSVNSLRNFKIKKIHYAILGAVLIAILGLFYYLAFQSSEVRITIELKKEEIDFQKKIIADANPAVTEVDPISLTIPAKELVEENLNTSKTGQATGRAEIGTKAKGFVNIYNKTTSDINIKAGTKITSAATNKQYVLTSDVNMKSAVVTSEGKEISIADDVPIEAVEVGEDYNISDSSSNTTFNLEGFTIDQVEVKRFEAFEGGASEEKTVVSQEDFDSLKEITNSELKEQGVKKIKAFIPSGYTLIEESVLYTEEKVESLPKVGDTATGDAFTISIEAKVTAIAVKETDLEQMANLILSAGEKEGEEFSVASLEDISITEVVRDGTKLSFVISSSGEVKSVIDSEAIKSEIKGKKLLDAENLILEYEKVNNVRIRFSPSYVPDSLQRVPSDVSRINIKVE